MDSWLQHFKQRKEVPVLTSLARQRDLRMGNGMKARGFGDLNPLNTVANLSDQ
jgi:hypothetical protein